MGSEMDSAPGNNRAGFHQPTRAELEHDALAVAPRLLGGILCTRVDGVSVAVRLTEVEAYHGRGTGPVPDPGSHARMGRTERNATMWGAPGHLYVYMSHGIHSCVNVACSPDGVASGVLLRAGEVIEGMDAATARRPTSRAPRDLARGPGRLGKAIGLVSARHNGIDALAGGAERAGALARLWLRDEPLTELASGLPSSPAIIAILVLALVCTALAFVLFFELIAAAGPVRATIITFVNPAVAVVLGIVILSEPITWGVAVGFPLVLLGSFLSTRPTSRALADEAAAESAHA